MSYLLKEVADRLNTNHLRVTVRNGWMAATPEASIIRKSVEIEIEDGEA